MSRLRPLLPGGGPGASNKGLHRRITGGIGSMHPDLQPLRSGGAARGIYAKRITDTNNDGRWYSTIDNWNAAALLQVNDLDGVGTVIYPTWAFTGTGALTGAGVQSAILELNSTQVDVGGSWRIRAESNASAASTPWSAMHKPGTATATATSVTVVSTVGTPEKHLVDVTTLVNEVMAGAAWVPGTPICFWAEPVTLGAFVNVTFAAAPSASAAKLTMTPYAHTGFEFNSANYLYKTAGASSVAPDAEYVCIAVKFRVNAGATPAPSGVAMPILSAAQTTPARQIIRFNIAYNNDGNLDMGLNATDFSLITLKDGVLSPQPGDGWHTVHIYFDTAGQEIKAYVDGVLKNYITPPDGAFSVGPGVADFTHATIWQIGSEGSAPGSGNEFWGDIAFAWIGISATPVAAFADPTLFYKSGDVDLGPDGTRYGRLPAPKVYFGGRQGSAGWQAGTNQGTGGAFVYVP